MKLTILNTKKRLAIASVLTIGLTIVAAVGLVKRTDAFTLIELQLVPAPVTLTDDQGARFVINNTFGTQEIHAQVNWNDAITDASLGLS